MNLLMETHMFMERKGGMQKKGTWCMPSLPDQFRASLISSLTGVMLYHCRCCCCCDVDTAAPVQHFCLHGTNAMFSFFHHQSAFSFHKALCGLWVHQVGRVRWCRSCTLCSCPWPSQSPGLHWDNCDQENDA